MVPPKGGMQSSESHLTEAVRERCSLESITQPTWHSMGGLELCRVFLFLGVWREKINMFNRSIQVFSEFVFYPLKTRYWITKKAHYEQNKPDFTLTWRPSYLGIYRPTFLHHWVEARRHGLVLPMRCARRAGRPGTAVVGRVRHGSWERASYWGRLRGTEEFVRQSVCGDWGQRGKRLVVKRQKLQLFALYVANPEINK